MDVPVISDGFIHPGNDEALHNHDHANRSSTVEHRNDCDDPDLEKNELSLLVERNPYMIHRAHGGSVQIDLANDESYIYAISPHLDQALRISRATHVWSTVPCQSLQHGLFSFFDALYHLNLPCT